MLKNNRFLLAICSCLCSLDVLILLQRHTILSNILGKQHLNLAINLLALLLLIVFSFIFKYLVKCYNSLILVLVCLVVFFIFLAIF